MHFRCPSAAIAVLSCSILGASLPAQNPGQNTPSPELAHLLLQPSEPSIANIRFDQDGKLLVPRLHPLDAYRSLQPLHQDMLLRILRRQGATPAVHGCWLTPPSPAAAALFDAAMFGQVGFQFASRWSSTATQIGGGLVQGDPTTITFSIVPDGTLIPDALGEGAANSDLFAAFNAAFSNPQTWQDRIEDAFTRWGDLTGITFVLEPNDDGADMFNNPGDLGVRGDIRIGGKFIDGSGSILAYNFVPQGGEMVLDTDDVSFYSNNANNYRRLFNIVAHESGHGIGILHACPMDNTKLLEPVVNTGFTGPQFDDILAGQRHYGDDLEPNDDPATATDLGILVDGEEDVTLVSIDGDTDRDYYQFQINADKYIVITASPDGSPYLEGPQTSGACSPGTMFDPSMMRDLEIEVLDAAGTNVVASANIEPAGNSEVLTIPVLPAGTYQLVIDGDPVDAIQLYRLNIEIGFGAEVEDIGFGCDGSACVDAIYEYPNFGLANSSVTFDYDNGDYNFLQGQGAWIPPAGANLGMGDNTEIVRNLGFTMPYPGGSTASIRICSNGWVTNALFSGTSNILPNTADFLAHTMWAPLWHDLNPGAGGSVWFDSTASRAVVTWLAIPNFFNSGSSTFQVQFWLNGDVHFVYQNISVAGDYLTGFSKTTNNDPGSVDLAATASTGLGVCSNPLPELSFDVSAPPVLGTTFDLVTTDIPINTLFGFAILSTTQLNPAINLTPLGMPGCELYQTLDVLVPWGQIGNSAIIAWPLPSTPTLAGFEVFCQSTSLTPGINAFGFAISNGLKLTVGTF